MSDQKQVRVRYAPSPTGHLHIGGARSALFNYLIARRNNGKFIVRIEDTDQKRNVEDAAEKQLENLKWLGIEWDESIDKDGGYGPYRSMERLHLYQPYVDQLLEEGKAYYCYCTEEELEAEREEQRQRGEMPRYSGKCRTLDDAQKLKYEQEGRKPTIRFHVPADREYVVEDLVRGRVTFESNGIGDFVIVKKDGIPTYNFAVAIDDHLMAISHVIRGEEHLSNTPRQLMIYEAFGWEPPKFAHVSLILNEKRQKMSKRDESIIQFVEQYRELGYLPEALINFLVLLGWAPEGEEEIFSMDELIDKFSLDRVNKSPAVFDTGKLKWMNNYYIKKAPLERIVDLCIPHLQKAGYLPDTLEDKDREWVTNLVGLYQEQLEYAAQIAELADLFFKDDITYDGEAQEVLSGEQVPEVLRAFYDKLTGVEAYIPDEIKAAIKATQKETGQKGKKLFMPIRVAATGQTHGPDLNQSLFMLGKEKVLERLKQAIDRATVS
ncbi:MAG: glutamate--tRNA ligase [Bacillaceae bacterium]|nr:glutamate--tRNA ligase [Bacillaceae bacterium]